MGPCSQMRRQLALVRYTHCSPCINPNTARRFFRYFQDASEVSAVEHFGSLCSAHRIMCRVRCPIPRVSAFFTTLDMSDVWESGVCGALIGVTALQRGPALRISCVIM